MSSKSPFKDIWGGGKHIGVEGYVRSSKALSSIYYPIGSWNFQGNDG